jgi:hypothetical protein
VSCPLFLIVIPPSKTPFLSSSLLALILAESRPFYQVSKTLILLRRREG